MRRMINDQIFTNPGGRWTLGSGKESDIVISSRMRIARNLPGYPFPAYLSTNQKREIVEKVFQAVNALEKSGGFSFQYYKLDELTDIQRRILLEKHLISPAFVEGEPGTALIVRSDEAVAIMVNEEDHLRIQCFFPALQLNEAWALADQIDSYLEKNLDFAFDHEFGFLTACPSNTGTGLRASVMLHLPALVMTKQTVKVFETLPRLGLTVRGIYGEGSEARGNLFQISNQVTLGINEEEIIRRLKTVVLEVIEQERQSRLWLQKEHAMQLYDNTWRSYGILKYARVLSEEEMMKRLSQLRLGMDMGIITALSGRLLNELMIKGQPAFLQQNNDKELTAELCDWNRAALFRSEFAKISEVKEND